MTDTKQPTTFWEGFLALIGLRGGGSETTATAHEQFSIGTRVLLFVIAAVFLSAAIAILIGGLFLIGGGVMGLVQIDTSPGALLLDGLFLIGVMGLVIAGIRYLVRSNASATQVAMTAGLALLFLVALLMAALSTSPRFDWWQGAKLVIGVALLLPAGLLAYHLTRTIAEGPYWWRSPFENAIIKELPRLMPRPAEVVDGPPQPTLRIELAEGNRTQYIDLGLTEDQLYMLATDLLRGRSLSEGDLGQDRMISPRGINQYRDLRAKLEQAGLVRMVNPEAPSQGYTMTRPGRAVMEYIVDQIDAHARARTNGDLFARARIGGVGGSEEENT